MPWLGARRFATCYWRSTEITDNIENNKNDTISARIFWSKYANNQWNVANQIANQQYFHYCFAKINKITPNKKEETVKEQPNKY